MPRWDLFSRSAGPAYALTGGLRLSSVKGVLRHLGVDAAVIETPYTPAVFARTAKGCGVVVNRDGRQMFSGLIASERELGWSAADGVATIKVACLGDNVHAARRIVYPDPARAGNAQTTAAYWTSGSVATSTGMLKLLSEQLGPAARPERTVAGLTLAADPGIGTVRNYKLRFENVLDALTTMSAASGQNLGFRVTSGVDGLLATVYAPRNRAASIRFSADLRNLQGFTYKDAPPDVTYALAAGQGDLTARLLGEYTTAVAADLAWGIRSEVFVDRNAEDSVPELVAAATDAVLDGAGRTSLACTLTDSTAATYGRDWGPGPGDLVTVYVGLPGQSKPATVVDVVREIGFEVDADGVEEIRPAIGSVGATAREPGLPTKRLAAIAKRLATLEIRK